MMFVVMTIKTHNKIKTFDSGYAPLMVVKLYYEVYGEGKTFDFTAWRFYTIGLNWSELIPQLSKTRKVIAIEMQGARTYTLPLRQRIIHHQSGKGCRN